MSLVVMNKNANSKFIYGFSLIEILVAISVFSILGLLVSRIVIQTLRTTNKTDATVRVRENVDYALSVMERQIRNSSPDPNNPSCTLTGVGFDDADGNASFSYVNNAILWMRGDGTSSNLTGSDVNITGATFTCNPKSGSALASVVVAISAVDAKATGAEGAQVTKSSTIYLRNY